jgi:hypothetical protein
VHLNSVLATRVVLSFLADKALLALLLAAAVEEEEDEAPAFLDLTLFF